MSISAMKEALEVLALFASDESDDGQMAISAYESLRQAIAETEKQEPAFYVIQATDRFGEGYEQTYWEDPNGFPVYTAPVHASDISQEPVDETAKCGHKWVGLEEEEILKCFDSVALGQVEGNCVIDKHVNIFNAIRAIEAKLKEKNT